MSSVIFERQHRSTQMECPFLPPVEEPITAAAMKIFGKSDRGSAFYGQALRCAQSLWLQGFPAQSLLLINRAFGAELREGDPILEDHPLPYRAAAWVMSRRETGQFIGNPRRHYQHLATRMVEPRRTQRAWRAWACWWIACRIFPEYPADERQLAEEGVAEPTRAEIVAGLTLHGISCEVEMWEAAEVIVSAV